MKNWMEKNLGRRLLAMVLCLSMVLSMAPVPAFAEGCTHHTEHTPECGFVAEVTYQPCTHQHDAACGYQEGAPCTHSCADGTCGYREFAPCNHSCGDGNCGFAPAVGCDHVHGEQCGENGESCPHTCGDGTCAYSAGAPCNHSHNEVCGYQEAQGCGHSHNETCGYREARDCGHQHDESCGYREAVAGSPCTFVCEICNAPQQPATPTCTCEIKCVDGNATDSCQVCAANIGDCTGKEQETPETCAHGNDPATCEVCASEARVAAVQAQIDALPEDVTAETKDTVQSFLTAVDAAKAALTETEQAQLDMTRYTALAEKLAALDKCAHDSDPLTCEACASEARVASVQALIDALPAVEELTAETEAQAREQLDTVKAAVEGLTEEEQAQLKLDKYTALSEYFEALDEAAKEPTEAEPIVITEWQWDYDEYIHEESGCMVLPITSEEFASYLSDDETYEVILSMLPGAIFFGEDELTLGEWTYEAAPEGTAPVEIECVSYQPEGFFKTCLPEGYVLADESTVLSLTLVLIPAENEEDTPVVYQTATNVPYRSYDSSTKAWNDSAVCDSATVVESTAEAVTWNDGCWYVVQGEVTIDSRITVSGNVHLILANGCKFTVNGGISVNEGNSLTIYAQSTGENMGKLTATGGTSGAGIGGESGYSGGSITINGGIVTAAGTDGAGIGGGSGDISGSGDGGSGGSITINGGTVTATSSSGAGIGGGIGEKGGDGGRITINGGTVTANGGERSAGIGGSHPKGNGGTIIISGGTVIANGGKSAVNDGEGAGIGDSLYGSGGTFSTGTNGTAVIYASSISDTSGNGSWGGKVYFPLNLTNCTATGGQTGDIVTRQDITYAKMGSTITLTAAEGLNFAGWKTSVDGVTVADDNTFTMPAGPLTVTAEKCVAIVESGSTTTSYSDFETAFIYADDRFYSTLTLQDNVTCDSDLTVVGRFSLELDGHTLDMGQHSLTVDGGEGGFTQYLTIKGSSEGSALTAQYLNAKIGTLTITGGQINAYINVLEEGTATITGGEFVNPRSNKNLTDLLPHPDGFYSLWYYEKQTGTDKFTPVSKDKLGTSYTGTLYVMEHKHDDYWELTKVTNTEHTYTCSVCGGVKTEDHSLDEAGFCTICGAGKASYVDANGVPQNPMPCYRVTADYLASCKYKLEPGWYVVTDPDLTIGTASGKQRIAVNGNVNLILADGCSFTVSDGIEVGSGKSLTIWGQSGGTGELVCSSNHFDAGIGGTKNGACGTVIINGGDITSTGGGNSAGIGGSGNDRSGKVVGTIEIHGGTVHANGGGNAPGIGSSPRASGNKTIRISGGTVYAQGGNNAAGIGGGGSSDGGTVMITGGTVTAFGSNAPGIGGGQAGRYFDPNRPDPAGNGADVTISNAVVIVNGIGGVNRTGSFSVTGDSVVISEYIRDNANTSGWNGIVFEGSNGQVYGSVTPTGSFEIPSGKILLIPENTSLTIPTGITVTNSGNVYMVGGTINVEGTLTNTETGGVYYPLTLTNCTAEGDVVTYPTEGGTRYGKAGGTVTLTGIPGEGQAVSSWMFDDANAGITVTGGSSFTMPSNTVAVTAAFGDILASVTTSGGDTTNFANFQYAFDAANGAEDSKLTLLANVSDVPALTVTGKFTLDLNGKTLTSNAETPITVNSKSKLTVIDSNTETTAVGSITSTVTDKTHKPEIDILAGGTFDFQRGEIKMIITNQGILSISDPAKVTVAPPKTAVKNYGNTTIYGGTLTGMTCVFVSTGNLTIEDGTFNALYNAYNDSYCVNNAGGKVSVKGGTFTRGEGNRVYTFNSNMGKTVQGGAFPNGITLESGNTVRSLLGAECAFYDLDAYNQNNTKTLVSVSNTLTSITEGVVVLPHPEHSYITFEQITGENHDFKHLATCGCGYSAELDHVFVEGDVDYNGFCKDCGAYQPATLNGDIYEISNAGQLYWFADYVNKTDKSASAKLMKDINASYTEEGKTYHRPWTPIGSSDWPYEGTFDGNDKTVRGLEIKRGSDSYIGFFGTVGSGWIKNLTIADCTVSKSGVNDGDTIAVLCGWLGGGTIEGCTNQVSLDFNNPIYREITLAGICGYKASGTIRVCTNSGAISGGNDTKVGGICGENSGSGEIKNCTNSGAISGGEKSNVGGICGKNDGGIQFCTNSGDIYGAQAGGICGNDQAGVYGCANSGTIEGYEYAGGICGYSIYGPSRCYNIGTVSGEGKHGPICGDVPNVDRPYYCYYLEDGETNTLDGTTAMTEEQFNRGEVTWLLNQDSQEDEGITWYQTIGEQLYPALSGGIVYHHESTCPEYDNVQNDSDKAHTPSPNIEPDGRHFCEICGTTLVASLRTTTEVKYGYRTIEQAFAAANEATWEDVILILHENVTAKNNLIVYGNFTLDLGGCTLDMGTPFNPTSPNPDTYDITIFDGGKLTVVGNESGNESGIESGYERSTLQGRGDNLLVVRDGGVLAIQGGIISSTSDVGSAVKIEDGGRAEITGGELQGYCCVWNAGTLVISGATLTVCRGLGGVCVSNSDKGTVAISGGTLARGADGYVFNTDQGIKVNATDATNTTNTTTTTFPSGVTFSESGYPRKILGDHAAYYEHEWDDRLMRVTDDDTSISNRCFVRSHPEHSYHYEYVNGPRDTQHNAICDCGYMEPQNHDFDDITGFCKLCDAYQPAELVDDTYEISNAGQLFWFADYVNSGNKGAASACGSLQENITIPTKADDTKRQWTPIGTDSRPYQGSFSGNGHSISGLYFAGDVEYGSLFGKMSGSISSLTVENIEYAESASCNFRAGICGYNDGGEIFHCTNDGQIGCNSVLNEPAGICHTNEGTISGCVNNGEVSGWQSANAGGICVVNNGTIKECVNTGEVHGGSVGGICALNGEDNSGTNIQNCANRGILRGMNTAGGICAVNSRTVSNCYHSGSITDEARDSGPIVGYSNEGSSCSNCYYLADRETDKLDGTTAKTDAQFRSGEVAYLLNGKTSGENVVWRQRIGTPYPIFSDEPDEIVYHHESSCPEYNNNPVDSGDSHTPSWDDETVCSDCGAAMVASVTIGATISGYRTIDQAFAAANEATWEDVTLKLLGNVKAASDLPVSGSFTLNLNGKTLELHNRMIDIRADGSLTVQGKENGSAITGDGFSNLGVQESGTLTIKSGEIIGTQRSVSVGGTATIEGGSLKAPVLNNSGGNLTITDNAQVIVDGDKPAVENFGTLTIKGGRLVGQTCVMHSAGTTTIEDGRFTPEFPDGSSYCVAYNAVGDNGSSLTITGGNFESSFMDGPGEEHTFFIGGQASTDEIHVRGGTFYGGVSVKTNGSNKLKPKDVLAPGFAFCKLFDDTVLYGYETITENAEVQGHAHSFTYSYIRTDLHHAACACGFEADQGHSPDKACVCGRTMYLDVTASEADKTKYENCQIITADYLEGVNYTLSDGWYVVRASEDGLTIGTEEDRHRITIDGDVKLILADGCNFTVNGGIGVNQGKSLTIYAQSEGESMGKLTARNAQNGIDVTASTFTINGGTVNATSDSGKSHAGIRYDRYHDNYGTIAINGGIVNATGVFGIEGVGATITISGGTVNAKGNSESESGKVTGSGMNVLQTDIIISGGTVIAEGIWGISGESSTIQISGDANVKATGNGSCGIIVNSFHISGGIVEARGSKYGLGCKYGSEFKNGSTISGGIVTAIGGQDGYGLTVHNMETAFEGPIFSTGDEGHAVIFASSIHNKENQNSWNGVIFDGSDGKVYGNVTLDAGFTIPSGSNLLIPEGATLNLNGHTVTNNGKVYMDGGEVEGTFSDAGTGEIYYSLTLTDCTASGNVSEYQGKPYSNAGSKITLVPQKGRTLYRWVYPDYAVVDSGNQFTMPAAPVTITAEYAAASVTVGETTTNYLTLKDAFNAANKQTATITLLEDVNIGQETLTVSGGEITLLSTEAGVDDHGETQYHTITAQGSMEEEHSGTAIAVTGGTLNFQSGTLNTSGYQDGISVSGGTLNYAGGTITENHFAWSIRVTGGTANISGGTVDTVHGGSGSSLNIRNDTQTGSGATISSLSVDGAETNLTGGSFGQIETTGNVSALLAQGYAYYLNGKWVDATNGDGNVGSLAAESGTIQILPIPVRITTQPAATTMTYGENKSLSVVAVGAGGKTVSYQWFKVEQTEAGENNVCLDDETASTLSLDGLNAGSYTYYCQLTCDDYVLNSNTVTVTVNKAVVEIPTITSKVYDGSVQTAEVPASERYTVKPNAGGTNEGSYDVVLELSDPNNYRWDTSDALVEAEITLKFTIKPRTLGVTWGETVLDYTGLDQQPTATATNVVEGESITLTVTGTGKTKGNYTATVSDFEAGEGTKKSNYCLPETPLSTPFSIVYNYEGQEGTDFTTNSVDENVWLAEDFVVTAKEGFALSLTNEAAEENWGSKLTVAQDGAGTLIFYVRKTATGEISLPVMVSYKVDKTTPTGTISYDDAYVTETSPVAVYKNKNVTVTIKGSDALSGVASVSYLVIDAPKSDKDLAGEDWTEGKTFTITAEDGATKYVYAKVVDNAGNVAYVRANYIVFDTTAPSITGVKNGETYYTTQTVKVSDTNLASLTLNGTAATSPITLNGNENATYTIVATDKVENKTTVTVTMKTLDSLTEKVKNEGDSTVTKGDKADLIAAKNALEALQNSATDAEKQEISKLLKPIKEALDKVEAVEQKIQALPESVQIDDEDDTAEKAIKAAREAYEKLTDHEKTLVDDTKLKGLESALVAYKITSGDGSVWNMGSGESLSFTANGPIRKLKQVDLDDKVLDSANYQVTKGSTIVTLEAAILQSLAEGSHTLRVVYTDGQTEEATFQVKRSVNYLDLTDEPAFQGRTEVFVDGVSYPIEVNGDSYVNLPETGELLTLFTYRTGAGDYGDYPTGMNVYRINRSASGTTVTAIPELDNLLQYSGCSIRVTGNRGIRMITSLDQGKKAALTGGGLAGFTLEEYGTVVSWASDLGEGELNLNSGKHNFAYKRGVADPVFGTSGGLTQYTNVLVGFDLTECSQDIVMRPYIVLRAADGNQYTLYGGCVTRSISYIAWQNRDTYKPGTHAYNYVHELMGLYKAA